jgi:uncharacterized membrane protein
MFTAPHLHAMFIHFPIALLIVSFLTELLTVFFKSKFLWNVAFYILILGTLGTIAAYISGIYAGDGINEGLLQLPIEKHEEAAFITLCLALVLSVYKLALKFFEFQKTWSNWLSIILYVLLIGSVARTGYLGGQLVFKHGAGVELALPDFEEQPTN